MEPGGHAQVEDGGYQSRAGRKLQSKGKGVLEPDDRDKEDL